MQSGKHSKWVLSKDTQAVVLPEQLEKITNAEKDTQM
jgi:hypothetical protein